MTIIYIYDAQIIQVQIQRETGSGISSSKEHERGSGFFSGSNPPRAMA